MPKEQEALVPADRERRALLRGGLSFCVMALWQTLPLNAEEKEMSEPVKKTLPSALHSDDVRSVSPALEAYTQAALLDGVWKRPELSPRDRSVVTVAALIARIQTVEMPYHFALALENGVKPAAS